ncbi:MAG: AAA family ATPase [Simkaniaceae bacterium]|nr:AAA family ATPase [Simkaniaceae bacterium]
MRTAFLIKICFIAILFVKSSQVVADKYAIDETGYMNKLVFVIGASGAGKTTAVRFLEKEMKKAFTMLYFDSIGVPSPEEMGDPETWQKEKTFEWVQQLRDKYLPNGHVLFDAQTRPTFIEEACLKNKIFSYKVILIDCSDEERSLRLIGRGHAALANPTMIQWARYLRDESKKRGYDILDNSLLDVETTALVLKTLIEN